MTREERQTREVELGRVVGSHGLRGELRVRWLGDGPDSLLAAQRLRLADASGQRDVEVLRAGRGRAGEVRLALAGVTSREAADALRGAVIHGPAAPLPEGEHYWYELVGCTVESETGRRVGTVREIWETGAHDVLVVDRPDGRVCLVPTARELMREVDVPGRRIVVEERPGLFDPADASPAGPRPGLAKPGERSEPCSGST